MVGRTYKKILTARPTGFQFNLDQKFPFLSIKTSLLGRLQAQTFPDATPPISKIHPSSKIAVTFEPMMQFWFLNLLNLCNIVYFMVRSPISYPEGAIARTPSTRLGRCVSSTRENGLLKTTYLLERGAAMDSSAILSNHQTSPTARE